MAKCKVLVLTWMSLCWVLGLTLGATVSAGVTTSRTTVTTPKNQSRHSIFDVSATKIDVKSKTATSIQVEWSPPEHQEASCRLVVRENAKPKAAKVTMIFDLSLSEKNVTITKLTSDTSYEITLECYGPNQKTIGRRIHVTTLAEDKPSTSKTEGPVDFSTDSWEPRIQPVKERTTKPFLKGASSEISIFGNSNSDGNITLGNYSSINQKSSSNENTKRLIWIIPTIAGSVAGLMIIVAATVACSRAMVKTKRNGKFTVSHNESGKKLITKSDAEEFAESERKQSTSVEGQCGGTDQKIVASEMTSVNRLQIRQPSHLTADNRAAISGISWGSEFDVLDKPDSIYTNETIEARSPRPIIPEPSKQVPTAFFRQNSLTGPPNPVTSQPWQQFSSLRAGTMPPSDDPPMYADTNISMVVPTGHNFTGQGVNIYTNVQDQESIYANTGPQTEERPPAIPPRPK